MRQGDTDISTYFNQPRLLWNEFDTIGDMDLCDCDSTSKLLDQFEQHQLCTFLLGLNDIFFTTRTHLLLMDPLPSLNQSYSLLVQ